MFELIESYVEDTLDELNERSSTAYKVQRITNELQFENIAASQADINYQLYISSVAFDSEIEAPGVFTAKVKLNFTFIVAGKDYTAYKEKFDNYLYPLLSILAHDSRGVNYTVGDSLTMVLNEISNVVLSDADKFEQNYYLPSIEFDAKGYADVINKTSYTKTV